MKYIGSLLFGFITGATFGGIFVMPNPRGLPEWDNPRCFEVWSIGSYAGMLTTIFVTVRIIAGVLCE